MSLSSSACLHYHKPSSWAKAVVAGRCERSTPAAVSGQRRPGWWGTVGGVAVSEHRAVAACRSCSFTILQTRPSFLNQRSCTITYIDQSQTKFSVMNQELYFFFIYMDIRQSKLTRSLGRLRSKASYSYLHVIHTKMEMVGLFMFFR